MLKKTPDDDKVIACDKQTYEPAKPGPPARDTLSQQHLSSS
jgi:hypothetical protein